MVGSAVVKIGIYGLLACALLPQKSFAVSLQYSNQVPESQKQQLNADLASLQNLVPIDADGELKRVLKLNAVNANEMNNWLSSRIHFVVEEAYQPGKGNLAAQAENANYPGAGVSLEANEQAEAEKSRVQVVMSNLGAALYMMGKTHKILIGASLSGIGIITIDSPRVGVLQVGEGLFRSFVKDGSAEVIKNEMHTLWRLTTLFHEARHSDGNGQSLSFKHVICPPGSNYSGKAACDDSANGAYRIGSLVMKSYSGTCKKCSSQEKELMGIIAADSMSRILVPVKRTLGVNDLCRLAENNGKNPAFCARQDTGSDFELDDTPEAVQL